MCQRDCIPLALPKISGFDLVPWDLVTDGVRSLVFARNRDEGEVAAKVFSVNVTREQPASGPDHNLFRKILDTGDVAEGAIGEVVKRRGVRSQGDWLVWVRC